MAFAAACGGSSASDRASTITQPKPKTGKAPAGSGKTLSESQLKGALLTVTDLPTGYKSVPVKPKSSSGPSKSDNADCAKRYKAIDKVTDKASAKAEADFEGPGLGTVLQQNLASYADENQVKTGLATLTKLFSDCPTFSQTDADGKIDYTLSPLSFPKLGDETLAIGVTIKNSSITAAADIVISRLGRNLQLIVQGGLGTDAVALEKAARAGVTRLASVR